MSNNNKVYSVGISDDGQFIDDSNGVDWVEVTGMDDGYDVFWKEEGQVVSFEKGMEEFEDDKWSDGFDSFEELDKAKAKLMELKKGMEGKDVVWKLWQVEYELNLGCEVVG